MVGSPVPLFVRPTQEQSSARAGGSSLRRVLGVETSPGSGTRPQALVARGDPRRVHALWPTDVDRTREAMESASAGLEDAHFSGGVVTTFLRAACHSGVHEGPSKRVPLSEGV